MRTYTPTYEDRMLVCFGRNMKHYRERKGITLRQLGEITGISYGYLGKLEMQNDLSAGVTLRKMCVIADALDVPVDALLFDVKNRDRTSIVRQATKRLEDLLKDATMLAEVIDEHS